MKAEDWIIPLILTLGIAILTFFVLIPAVAYFQENGLRVLWYGAGGK